MCEMMLSLQAALKDILAGSIEMTEAGWRSWLMMRSDYSQKHTHGRW